MNEYIPCVWFYNVYHVAMVLNYTLVCCSFDNILVYFIPWFFVKYIACILFMSLY